MYTCMIFKIQDIHFNIVVDFDRTLLENWMSSFCLVVLWRRP